MNQTFEDRFGIAPDITSWIYASEWLRHTPVRRAPGGRFIPLPLPQLPFHRRKSGLYIPMELAWGIVGTPITAGCVGGGNVPSTSYGNTSAANLILMYIGQYGAATVLEVPDDDQTNTWIPLTSVDSAGANRAYGRWWYVASPTTSATHHFGTKNGNNAFGTIIVFALSGADVASPFDTENHASSGGGNATLQNGSVTPASNTYAVFTGLTFSATATPAIDSGFTLGPTTQFNNGVCVGAASAYKLGGLSGTEAPTWSSIASSESATPITVFKVGSTTGFGHECFQPISQPTNHYRPTIVM